MDRAFLLVFIIKSISNVDDYDKSWTNNLRTDCKHQELMRRLEKIPKKCASAGNGTDLVQWEECKKKLKRNIISMCPNSKMRKVK